MRDSSCPDCGTTLATNVLQGLCPTCVLTRVVSDSPPAEAQNGGGAATSASWEPRFEPGDKLGLYTIQHLLGRGGLGEVYAAESAEGRLVALKVLRRQLRRFSDRAQFLVEAELAATASHPNVVYVFEAGEVSGIPMIAMELIPGGTLQDRVRTRGALKPSEAVEAILQVIRGLTAAYAHGVLHRDVKPSNCLIDSDGTVKVGDFGVSISTTVETPRSAVTGVTFQGTPGFASPEQMRGDHLDVRSDIYSVGATLYYLLTGVVPETDLGGPESPGLPRPDHARDLRRFNVPRGLAAVVERCLEVDSRFRFGSYADLEIALEGFAEQERAAATPAMRVAAALVDVPIALSPAPFLMAYLVGTRVIARPAAAIAVSMVLPALIYLAVADALFGKTVGERASGIEVVTDEGGWPRLGCSWLRRAVSLGPLLISLGIWSLVGSPSLPLWGWTALVGVGLAWPFVTARESNGWSGVHDLVTGVRVVQTKLRPAGKTACTGARERPPGDSSSARIGPYEVTSALGPTEVGQLFTASDPLLHRRVWVHVVSTGTPSLSAVRKASYVGQPRWLSGPRTPFGGWDAYELSSGHPFLAERASRPWREVKDWLRELTEALSQLRAESQGRVALDRIWITDDGHAQLLDFRAPHLEEGRPAESLSPQRLLGELAIRAIDARIAPLPVGARVLVDRLLAEQFSSLAPVAQMLKRLEQTPDVVSKTRRNVVAAASASSMLVAMWLVNAGGARGYWNVPLAGALSCVLLAIVCAWLLRGGLWLHVFGIAAVDGKGREVSRTRAAARALVAWSWMPLVAICAARGWYDLEALVLLSAIGGLLWSTTTPARGPHDWLVQTTLVPR